VNLTKNAATALTWDQIRVNAILPGWVDTPGEHATLKKFHNAAENWLEEAEKGRPNGRLIKPDEIARLIAFLASDESGLMTGAVIDFDQGVPGISVISSGPLVG
jgi:NAD(P)-dependent dehydrogenase (short-subunit alcohol dehydrogenase family)